MCHAYVSKYCESLSDWSIPLNKDTVLSENTVTKKPIQT